MKAQIYLDTSVINFLFADDAPEKKEITEDFFQNSIQPKIYETFISAFVLAEIELTNDTAKKSKLLKVINDYPISFLEISDEKEVRTLAQAYIDNKIIPEKKLFDALHISICTIYQINFLVSWNFRHLANIRKEQQVRLVNIANNYFHDLRIISPTQLMDYESERF